jgi:hypothetical protein
MVNRRTPLNQLDEALLEFENAYDPDPDDANERVLTFRVKSAMLIDKVPAIVLFDDVCGANDPKNAARVAVRLCGNVNGTTDITAFEYKPVAEMLPFRGWNTLRRGLSATENWSVLPV